MRIKLEKYKFYKSTKNVDFVFKYTGKKSTITTSPYYFNIENYIEKHKNGAEFFHQVKTFNFLKALEKYRKVEIKNPSYEQALDHFIIVFGIVEINDINEIARHLHRCSHGMGFGQEHTIYDPFTDSKYQLTGNTHYVSSEGRLYAYINRKNNLGNYEKIGIYSEDIDHYGEEYSIWHTHLLDGKSEVKKYDFGGSIMEIKNDTKNIFYDGTYFKTELIKDLYEKLEEFNKTVQTNKIEALFLSNDTKEGYITIDKLKEIYEQL